MNGKVSTFARSASQNMSIIALPVYPIASTNPVTLLRIQYSTIGTCTFHLLSSNKPLVDNFLVSMKNHFLDRSVHSKLTWHSFTVKRTLERIQILQPRGQPRMFKYIL